MAEVKYYYDPETLSYRKIDPKPGRKFRLTLLFVLSSLLFALIGLFFFLQTDLLKTPQELSLQRELENMKIQYKIVNNRLDLLEGVLQNVEERDNNLYRVYFEVDPIPDEQRKAGFGGVNRYRNLEGYQNSEMIINTKRRLDILTKQLEVQSKSLDEIYLLATEKEKLLRAIPAIQPVSNEDLTRMASGFGWRSDPFTKVRKMHWGMDFTAPRGTPIYATGDGVVKEANNKMSGYGNHILIDHGFGYQSFYAHLYKFNVRPRQRVKRGDLIGFVGNTGRSEAPHLHYEIFKDGVRINPINFYYGSLTADEFAEILRKASLENQSLD
ncbi:MAG: M23 family metallopeptidase [Bacteroidetes bacterium]|nr:M23 family metallopeptidase [Bacteroidota bacterium]